MKALDTITVYNSHSPVREPSKFLRGMARDLAASRELAWRLFVRDIKAQYRQTFLGYIWAFLPSVMTSLTFVFLNSQKILSISETRIPYPAFVLIGTTLWQSFIDALNSPLKLVQQSSAMLAKINFPREALVLAGLAEVVFNFTIRAVILVFAVVWFHIHISSAILLAPVGVLCLISLGLTLGILLTPIGILYQDVGRGVGLISGFWMLLTPVVYPAPRAWPATLLSKWNPVSPILTTTRDWLTGGTLSQPSQFIAIVCATIALLMIGWIIYRVAMPHLVERMAS